ncbi:MAG: YcxB family protein [Eubacteriales bacterium]
MRFRFNVDLTDDDYLEYNKFWMLRSPYGKKHIKTFRITITVLFCIFIFILLYLGGFWFDAFLRTIPVLILLTVFQICLSRFLFFSLKSQIKILKKTGKMGYSPSSVIEFYDECFIENTEENKTEQKYSGIERISIVDNKMIYIHVNNIMAYILPLSCFESREQYEDFIKFIKMKTNDIEIYEANYGFSV